MGALDLLLIYLHIEEKVCSSSLHTLLSTCLHVESVLHRLPTPHITSCKRKSSCVVFHFTLSYFISSLKIQSSHQTMIRRTMRVAGASFLIAGLAVSRNGRFFRSQRWSILGQCRHHHYDFRLTEDRRTSLVLEPCLFLHLLIGSIL